MAKECFNVNNFTEIYQKFRYNKNNRKIFKKKYLEQRGGILA